MNESIICDEVNSNWKQVNESTCYLQSAESILYYNAEQEEILEHKVYFEFYKSASESIVFQAYDFNGSAIYEEGTLKNASTYTQNVSSPILPNDSTVDVDSMTIINNSEENQKIDYFDYILLVERESEFQKFGITFSDHFLADFEEITQIRIKTEYIFKGPFKNVSPEINNNVPVLVEIYNSEYYNFLSVNSIVFDQSLNLQIHSEPSFSKTASDSTSTTYTLIQKFKFDEKQFEKIKLASYFTSGKINCFGKFCSNKVIIAEIELYEVILPGLIGIIMGIVILYFAEWSKISNSLLLLLIGMLFGATLFTKVQMSQILSPHMIMWVLLPPLLFESAAGIDFHIFSKLSPQVFLLAGPGVLFCTFSTGAIMYWSGFADDFNTGDDPTINYLACCILGAITAATDPVAVVALFKELGTEKKISLLIEGESMLNDGSGVVTLEILIIILISLLNSYHGATGAGSNAGDLVWTAVKLAIGGPLVGLLGAWIVKSMLPYIKSPKLQAVNTFMNIYILFFVGEEFLGCSGVLIVIAYGLYFSAHGNIYLSNEGKELLNEFTEIISWMSETLIFLISGVILGEFFRNTMNNMSEKFGMIFLLYFILIVTRALMLLMAYPVMKYTGYGFNYQRYLLLNWSALRGAVGLCGALIVMGELEFPLAYQNLVVFYTGGIVVLTILVNGSTCAAMMDYIGMSHLGKDQVEDNLEVTSQINNICLEFQLNEDIPMLSKLLCKKVRIYDYIKDDYIKAKSEMQQWVNVGKENKDNKENKEFYVVQEDTHIDPLYMEKQLDLDLAFMTRMFQKDTVDLYQMLLLTYFKSVKYYYFQKFENFYLSRENFQILLSSVNYAIDNIHKVDKNENDTDSNIILEYMKNKYRSSYLMIDKNDVTTMNYLNMQILNTFKSGHHQALQKTLSEYLHTNDILIDSSLQQLLDSAHVNLYSNDSGDLSNGDNKAKRNGESRKVVDKTIFEILKLLVKNSVNEVTKIDEYIIKYKMYDDYNFNYAYEESIKLLNTIEKKIKQLYKDGLIDETKLQNYIDLVHEKRYQLFDNMNYLEQDEIELLYIDSFKYYFTGGKNAIKDEQVDKLFNTMMSPDANIPFYKQLTKNETNYKSVKNTAKIIVPSGDKVQLTGCYMLFEGSIQVEFDNGKTVNWQNENRVYRMVVGVQDKYTVTAVSDCILYKTNIEFVIKEYLKVQNETDMYLATVCRTILCKYICEQYYKLWSTADEQLLKSTGQGYVFYYEQVLNLLVKHVMHEELILSVLDKGMTIDLEPSQNYYVTGPCEAFTRDNNTSMSDGKGNGNTKGQVYDHMVLRQEQEKEQEKEVKQNFVTVKATADSVLLLTGTHDLLKELGEKTYKFSTNKVSLLDGGHIEKFKTQRSGNSRGNTYRMMNKLELGTPQTKTNYDKKNVTTDYQRIEQSTLQKSKGKGDQIIEIKENENEVEIKKN